MTVSTVVAGLLPIMWSTRVGSEVMKPLATPVLGGMVSSLLHVLIVTPVVFFWLHERRLGLQHQKLPVSSAAGLPRRWALVVIGAAMILVLAAGAWRYSGRSSRPSTAAPGVMMQQVT